MNNQPLISVVIPCYNDGTYLPETLNHLQKQTFKDFETIVVNDGSTEDTTLQILKQINQPNVTVLHKENGRMSSARNFGVKHARGEFVAALDADDYFHPNFFEKALAVLHKKQNVAVVSSYIKLFGEKKKVSKPRGGNEYNFIFSNQCPACALVRTSCWNEVGGYDEAMTMGYEDWEFYIRITQKGWLVHIIPEYLFFYRQTVKSTHNNYTLPNRTLIINYIVEKHKDWYLKKLKELITAEQIIYRNSRVSYPVILELIENRIKGKYE